MEDWRKIRILLYPAVITSRQRVHDQGEVQRPVHPTQHGRDQQLGPPAEGHDQVPGSE